MAQGAPNRKKRKLKGICDPDSLTSRDIDRLLNEISYEGHPHHKSDPGDFNLQPPSAPRRDKTLCNEYGVTRKTEAVDLLRQGIEKGLISKEYRNGFPQNIWAVWGGVVFEAALSDAAGKYHGYPMPNHDRMREHVLNALSGRAE